MLELKTKNLVKLLNEINDEANLNLEFVLLTIFSCLIATLGLHLNSASVVIGAMIIAPLMQPLLAISAELLTGDLPALKEAIITLLAGIAIGFLISFILSLIINLPEPTAEIIARTKPNLLDFGVAIFAGATAAYVRSQEKLMQTIGGVAIAVALMPPLCVVGYEIAHQDLRATMGATLLFVTNLNGIIFAGSITFLLLGFYKFARTWKWLSSTGFVAFLIVIPLSFSLIDLYKELKLRAEVKKILVRETATFSNVELVNVNVSKIAKLTNVEVIIRSSNAEITSKQVSLVENFLKEKTNQEIELIIEIIPSLIVKSE